MIVKQRKEEDKRILSAEYMDVEDVEKWIRSLFFGEGTESFRIPEDVFDFGIGVMLTNYRAAKTEDIRRQMRRKMLHTREVVEAGIDIMKNVGEENWDPYAVGTVTFLHDMGRFPQAHLGSYSDAATGFDHAGVGAEMILTEDFPEAHEMGIDMKRLAEAVREHSRLTYTDGDMYGKLIRDADKLAIMQHYLDHVADYPQPVGEVTPGALEAFLKGQMVLKSDMRTQIDVALSLLAWEFDLNYGATREIFASSGAKKVIQKAVREMDEEVGRRI